MYALYDFDLKEFATVELFSEYNDAVEHPAAELDNVIIIEIPALNEFNLT